MVGLRGWAGLWCLGWLSEQGSLAQYCCMPKIITLCLSISMYVA